MDFTGLILKQMLTDATITLIPGSIITLIGALIIATTISDSKEEIATLILPITLLLNMIGLQINTLILTIMSIIFIVNILTNDNMIDNLMDFTLKGKKPTTEK